MEKEWNLDQCPSNPAAFLYCHVVLVEALKAPSLILPKRPNEVPSPSLREISVELHIE